MPKHKLNLNAAEEPVPIDDTGPEVDVDIDESPELPIEPQQPDKPILGGEGGAEAIPEVETEKKKEVVAETDEHEEYSKNVKKRIDKLTGKLRESERREKAATEYAKNAQQKIAALAVEAQRVQALNQERNVQQGQVTAPQQFTQETVPQPQSTYPDPDPKAQDWAEDNPWFGNDRAMTMTSFVIHQDLLNEGFDATSNEYYDEVNKRIRTEFPHKFEETTPTSRPAQAVAPAKRSTKSGRKTVRLTPSQVTIAKKLGVPLEEYAKYVE